MMSELVVDSNEYGKSVLFNGVMGNVAPCFNTKLTACRIVQDKAGATSNSHAIILGHIPYVSYRSCQCGFRERFMLVKFTENF